MRSCALKSPSSIRSWARQPPERGYPTTPGTPTNSPSLPTGARLLEDDAHCRAFLRNLDRARKEWRFQVWAYVMMPNRVHRLLWPTEPVYDMADIRQSIKQPFAKAALARMTVLQDLRLARLSDKRRRHYWQLGGGYDRNMHSAAACKKSIDTIHDNPVVAGLCALP